MVSEQKWGEWWTKETGSRVFTMIVAGGRTSTHIFYKFSFFFFSFYYNPLLQRSLKNFKVFLLKNSGKKKNADNIQSAEFFFPLQIRLIV